MSLVIALVCILFLGIVLLLVIVNHGVVDVNLLLRSYEHVPVGVVIVISLVTGMVFASFLGVIDGVRIRIHNRRLRKKVAHLEDELEDLRHRHDLKGRGPVGDSPPPVEYPSI